MRQRLLDFGDSPLATPPESLRAELAADLAAACVSGREFTSSADMTRPSLLRSAAEAMAARVTQPADRLACTAEDAPLGAAIALATGLPLVMLTPSSSVGELHSSERVVGVMCFATPETEATLTRAADRAGASLDRLVALVAPDRDAGDGDPDHPVRVALYILRETGRLTHD